MMGYETFKQKVNSIKTHSNLLVQLSVKPTILNEVIVSAKKLTAREIIEKAIHNIKINYPQKRYLLDGFYREYVKENEKYIALFEAAVSIYDNGYKTPLRHTGQLKEQVYLNETRQCRTANFQTKIYKVQNHFYEMLLANDVKYGSGDRLTFDPGKINYQFEKIINLGEQLVYVIITGNPWSSRIYIDAGSFAILKIEMDARWEGANLNEWKMSDSIMNRTPFIKKTIRFKKYNRKYFLEYMNYSWRIEGFKKGSNKVLFTSDFFQELLVNKITLENIKKPDRKNRMSSQKIVELQAKPYNEPFWKTYNVIRDSPLNSKIIKDLEEVGKLEDQFKKVSPLKSK